MKEMQDRNCAVEARECPFCGGKAMLSHVTMVDNPYYHRFTVYCEECYARVMDRDTKEEVLEAWNTRAGDKE